MGCFRETGSLVQGEVKTLKIIQMPQSEQGRKIIRFFDAGREAARKKTVEASGFSCEALFLNTLESVCDPLKFHIYQGSDGSFRGRWEFDCLNCPRKADCASSGRWKGHVTNGILFRETHCA